MNNYFKITKVDALSFTLGIMPLISFCMALAPFIFGDITFNRSFDRATEITIEDSSFFFLLGLLLLPISFFFYIRRVKFIHHVLTEGNDVAGIITAIRFDRDRGYVSYSYDVDGHTYNTTNRIMKSSSTEHFSDYDPITVRYDHIDPRKGFVENMYRLKY